MQRAPLHRHNFKAGTLPVRRTQDWSFTAAVSSLYRWHASGESHKDLTAPSMGEMRTWTLFLSFSAFATGRIPSFANGHVSWLWPARGDCEPLSTIASFWAEAGHLDAV